MGRKHAGEGKQVYFCVAVLIFLAAAGCCALGPVGAKVEDPWTHLALGRSFFAEGDYANALRQDERAVALAARGPVAQEALLYMGLIYAHPANPERDYAKSVICLRESAENYPNSPFAELARIVVTILEQNDELSRTAERLSATIKALGKVDTGIEKKETGLYA